MDASHGLSYRQSSVYGRPPSSMVALPLLFLEDGGHALGASPLPQPVHWHLLPLRHVEAFQSQGRQSI